MDMATKVLNNSLHLRYYSLNTVQYGLGPGYTPVGNNI